jgi:hypothetical protein
MPHMFLYLCADIYQLTSTRRVHPIRSLIAIGRIVLGPLWRRESGPLENLRLKRGHTLPQDPNDARPGHV